jgi:hypothetical protein
VRSGRTALASLAVLELVALSWPAAAAMNVQQRRLSCTLDVVTLVEDRRRYRRGGGGT